MTRPWLVHGSKWSRGYGNRKQHQRKRQTFVYFCRTLFFFLSEDKIILHFSEIWTTKLFGIPNWLTKYIRFTSSFFQSSVYSIMNFIWWFIPKKKKLYLVIFHAKIIINDYEVLFVLRFDVRCLHNFIF